MRQEEPITNASADELQESLKGDTNESDSDEETFGMEGSEPPLLASKPPWIPSPSIDLEQVNPIEGQRQKLQEETNNNTSKTEVGIVHASLAQLMYKKSAFSHYMVDTPYLLKDDLQPSRA